MAENKFGGQPKQDIVGMTSQLVEVWQAMAAASQEIAHARRTLFNAYVAEGFNESQALELVKQA